MDDVTTREVDRSLLSEVTTAPEQEGVDAVDERRPERDEDAPGRELDPAEHAAEEQQRCDRREHELEVGEAGRREGERDQGVGRRHGLPLLLMAVQRRARFPYEVVEEVLPGSGCSCVLGLS